MLKIKITTSLICVEVECLDTLSSPIILQTTIRLIEKAVQATKDMELKVSAN